ncbi:molybdopterin-dependent oxidoreductase [Kitasatospora purpeofusca]|uniref:molybdopterin-dependent oxidoreductase n=1 Tax=Kitasatospora purpeofusca TaxID=67352 RepID=UPI0036B3ED87
MTNDATTLRDRPRAPAAALPVRTACGIAAVCAGLAAGELAAALVRPQAAPVVAIGSAAIDLAPTAVKEWAVRSFGTWDKTVLLIGIHTTMGVTAAVLGPVAAARRATGVLLSTAFGGLGVWAALARPDATTWDALPSAAAALVCAAVLLLLTAPRTARRAARQSAGRTPGRTARRAAPPDARPAGPGPRQHSGTDSTVTPGDRPAPAADEPPPVPHAHPGRRSALTAGAVVLLSAGLGSAGRHLADRRNDVSAARASLTLPPPARPLPPPPPRAGLAIPGLPPLRTPVEDFYRVDTALTLPRIDPRDWKLRIHGMVDHPFELSFADLLAQPLEELDHTLSCVSGEVGGPYAGTTRWLGAPLPALLRRAGVRAGADQLLGRSKDGMTIGTPLECVLDGRAALLAVAMDGAPLPVAHGFPCRSVVPGLYGYTSATKWLVDLEVTTFAARDPYWVRRGWDRTGEVRTASRIDVPAAFARVPAGEVVVAGTAWATHRGIAAVEVRVDGGPWQEARLAADAGPDVWRQWHHTWTAAAPGTHRLEVRATDATGAVQEETRRPPFPSGATGWHSTVVTVH